MPETADRVGARLMGRPDYPSKPRPLTGKPGDTVADSVVAMTARSYGCIVVVADREKVIGIVTERDIMNKVVGKGADPNSITLAGIMTAEPRLARETDGIIDWLRIMSNERFRRLPVVD